MHPPGDQGAQESRVSLECRVMVRPQVPEDSPCLEREASEQSNRLEVRPMKEMPPGLDPAHFLCSGSPCALFP